MLVERASGEHVGVSPLGTEKRAGCITTEKPPASGFDEMTADSGPTSTYPLHLGVWHGRRREGRGWACARASLCVRAGAQGASVLELADV